MRETRQIIEAYKAGKAAGSNMALATVIEVKGSAYRRPGAQMLLVASQNLVANDLQQYGTISGGCIDQDVIEQAKQIWQNPLGVKAKLLTYDNLNGQIDPFMPNNGCQGYIVISLESISMESLNTTEANPNQFTNPLEFVNYCWQERKTGLISSQLKNNAPPQHCYKVDYIETEAEPESLSALPSNKTVPQLDCKHASLKIEPPVKLLLCGPQKDTKPLEELCQTLGWEHQSFTNLDYRKIPITNLVDSKTAIVLMTHNLDDDRLLLEQAIKSDAFYIGLLGPKKRSAQLLEKLKSNQTIHTPIGLDLGAETPEEIALSIASEILVCLRKPKIAEPLSLKDKDGPIHESNGNRQRVTALILAAGGSTRLGRPKQLLPYAGTTLINHVLKQVLLSSCDEIIVVVGAHAELIKQEISSLQNPSLQNPKITTITNEKWQTGIGSSISCGIKHITRNNSQRKAAEAVVILTCDQPLISAGHIDELVNTYTSANTNNQLKTSAHLAIASAYKDTIGIPALFSQELFGKLNELDNEQGAKKILLDCQAMAIPFSGGEFDIDTKKDYDALLGTMPDGQQSSRQTPCALSSVPSL
jgi:xanthine/CO dehydrogenase XdhC/CoxF family maturation factor/CTP:molybdopterin cytidylyltransferase MocA